MKFYETLQFLLSTPDIKKKFEVFTGLFEAFKADQVDFVADRSPIVFDQPSYASFTTVVPLGGVRRSKDLQTKEAQTGLIHSIAHIEFSAIDLALDAAYRFRGMPREFYHDWLEVAEDEIRHFKMLISLLDSLGAKYGDLPVHNGLFVACRATDSSFLERMAVVPRSMEANGLDANLQMKRKLELIRADQTIEELKKTLAVILDEEISHVHKGDKWFKYACNQLNLDSEKTYMELALKHNLANIKREINVNARLEAGFTCSELKFLTNKEIC